LLDAAIREEVPRHGVAGRTFQFHYPFDLFVESGKRTHLDVAYIDEWNHSRGQKMMVFTPAGERRAR
jgi:hypothetical protein